MYIGVQTGVWTGQRSNTVKVNSHVSPAGVSEAKVVYKEPLFVNDHQYLVTVFIREAAIQKNSASEYVARWPQGMVVKFFSCTNMKRMNMDKKPTTNVTPRIPVRAT